MEKPARTIALLVLREGVGDLVGEYVAADDPESRGVLLKNPMTIEYHTSDVPFLTEGYLPQGLVSARKGEVVLAVPEGNIAYVAIVPLDADQELCHQYKAILATRETE